MYNPCRWRSGRLRLGFYASDFDFLMQIAYNSELILLIIRKLSYEKFKILRFIFVCCCHGCLCVCRRFGRYYKIFLERRNEGRCGRLCSYECDRQGRRRAYAFALQENAHRQAHVQEELRQDWVCERRRRLARHRQQRGQVRPLWSRLPRRRGGHCRQHHRSAALVQRQGVHGRGVFPRGYAVRRDARRS